jgi:hypothetical protein
MRISEDHVVRYRCWYVDPDKYLHQVTVHITLEFIMNMRLQKVNVIRQMKDEAQASVLAAVKNKFPRLAICLQDIHWQRDRP